ncbi:hypothetical protein [Thiothrix fructosivorans]|jgi:hypothetical protein|uniref:Uncharacterized protein n=1 Tax=Thiothrix fructosivorans TaxID=111770 RepID=A0A8B0SLM3_9GAMM|nr:hypothetical protein [Thiothrix fructosivorans]MBO0612746.1 hypothetical protein [Thiothrix fructosivorans]QTX11789.1 hypothetical protein J1836_005445 [Thiothrix fructosivorans]
MTLKKLLANLGKITVAIMIVFGGFAIWVNHAEQSALTQATNFCSNISIGQQVDAILEQAWAVGADKRHTRWVTGEAGKADWLPVTFIGAGVFSRHFCSIDAQDGIVITKQVKFMD